MEKRIKLKENDVYSMCESKDYLILNNNYNGLTLYDSGLNFIKNIIIAEDLMIYEIYNSRFDNRIVIFDAENQMLYFIDLNKVSHVISVSTEVIFLNFFKFDNNNFILRSREVAYTFCFESGQLISSYPYVYEFILSVSNQQIMIEKNCKLYTVGNKGEINLNQAYDDNSLYVISEKYVIEYDENNIFLVQDSCKTKIFSSKDNYIFRKVLLRDNVLTILANNLTDTEESEILQYSLTALLRKK